ncbi:MAG: hypothetical protein NVS3B20_18820 [Polyangiales bacterium]
MSPDAEFDAATELALHLAWLRDAHALDELVVSDRDGGLLAAAGDAEYARALGAFAAAMLKRDEVGGSRTFHCGKVHVELILLRGHVCALAAKATFVVLNKELLGAELTAAFALPSAPSIGSVESEHVDSIVSSEGDACEFDMSDWETPVGTSSTVAA